MPFQSAWKRAAIGEDSAELLLAARAVRACHESGRSGGLGSAVGVAPTLGGGGREREMPFKEAGVKGASELTVDVRS